MGGAGKGLRDSGVYKRTWVYCDFYHFEDLQDLGSFPGRFWQYRPSGPTSAHGPSVALTRQRRRGRLTGRPSGRCPSSLARTQGAFSSSLPPPHFPPSPSRRWALPWNMYSTSSLVTSAYRMAVTSSRQPSPTLAPGLSCIPPWDTAHAPLNQALTLVTSPI